MPQSTDDSPPQYWKSSTALDGILPKSVYKDIQKMRKIGQRLITLALRRRLISHLERNSIRLLINQSGGETYRLQTAQNINSLETKVKKTFQPSACSIINESQTSGDRAKQAYSIQGGPLSWQVQPSATREISVQRRTSRVKSSGFTTRCQQVRYVEYVSLLMTGN